MRAALRTHHRAPRLKEGELLLDILQLPQEAPRGIRSDTLPHAAHRLRAQCVESEYAGVDVGARGGAHLARRDTRRDRRRYHDPVDQGRRQRKSSVKGRRAGRWRGGGRGESRSAGLPLRP